MTKNFSKEEFACPCCGECFVHPSVVLIWQAVRDKFGKAVTITSGTRCEKHNAEVGGVPTSQHVKKGDGFSYAADGVVDGVSAGEVAEFVRGVFPSSLGVGEYEDFVHIDVRMDRAYRWGHKK